MIYAILSCISIVVLGVCWFLYRRNIEFFLCLLIAISSEFFYLLPRIQGPDDYKLLLLPIVLILLLESFIVGKLAFGRYGWWVISFLAISVIGIFVARAYGQDLSLGIKAAKFIPLALVYFLLAGRQINAEKFVRYFVVMGLVVASIATVQYLSHGRINFFADLPVERLTMMQKDLRITVGQYVIAAGAVVAFVRYKQTSGWLYLFASVALYFEMIFVQQTRGFIAAILFSLFVIYMFTSRFTAVRLSLYLMICGMCLSSWLILSDVDFAGVALGKKSGRRLTDRRSSFEKRLKGYTYYWERILEQPVAGYGLLNFNWEGNNEKKMQARGIHLSDIGATHFIVQSGFIGLIWLLYGLLKIWRDFLRFPDKRLISCYVVIATFTAPTLDMMLRYDSMFIFFVFVGILAGMRSSDTVSPVAQGT
jgi:hypothetical protein